MAEGRDLESLLGEEARVRLIRRLDRFLDLERWGFRLVHAKPLEGPVVFESAKCRLFCRLDRERGGDEIAIYYGRKHAPNEDSIIEWDGERCFPWHNPWALHVPEFLDGDPPAKVVERRKQRTDAPTRIAFLETTPGKTLKSPEWGIALEGFLWERCGERLFSLFDIREADLWEEFRRFVRDYHTLRPEPENLSTEKLFGIPPWQIC